jgi:hypothetical protein
LDAAKIYSTAVITVTISVIAAAAMTTTTASFPNVTTVFATLQAPEQLGDNATTGTTAPPPVGGGQEEQQQQTIHITKDGTNSYLLSVRLSRASVGSFDTAYTVVGERSAIRSAENLIISTITRDFRNSSTIDYITTDTRESPLSSPFATPEQITERITNDLRRDAMPPRSLTRRHHLLGISAARTRRLSTYKYY